MVDLKEPCDDLDRFDPENEAEAAEPEFDYSSLSPEELDNLIDHDYSLVMSPQCEAAIMGNPLGLFILSVFVLIKRIISFSLSFPKLIRFPHIRVY